MLPSMSFVGLIVRNLLRQRTRSLLTLLGISLGITTVVALGCITAGMRSTAGSLATSGGADFMVAQAGASDLSFSRLPESKVGEVAAVRGVRQAHGVMLHISQFRGNVYFFLMGRTLEDLAANPLRMRSGRMPRAEDEAAFGTDAGARLGETVTIDNRRIRVVGIYETDNQWERAGAVVLLATAQALERAPDTVTIIYVRVEPGADPEAVARRVDREVEGVASIADAADYSKVDQGFALLDAANLAISFLAVVIGGIGVMNTMIMSIFERTREIGVLRAVGWRRSRVLRMIVTESVLLCIAAGFVGAAFGAGIASLATRLPSVGAFMTPAFPPRVFVQGFVVAAIVGLLGALYPAIRATRLTPMEALRHE
jgi:putative ABC transport system permease protein